jgi:CRP/FNR family transcriptional regulator
MAAPVQAQDLRCLQCPVRQSALCEGVPMPLLPAHAANTFPIVRQPGQRIVEEEAAADSLFIMTAGIAKSQKMLPDGRLQIIGFLLPGASIGLETAGRYEYTVEAIVTARFCRLPRGYLGQLLAAVPDLWRHLLHIQSKQLARAHDHIVLLGRHSTIERLAGFLLCQFEAAGHRAQGNADDTRAEILPLPMSRFDIADHLGMRFETVSRILGQMKEAGVIGAAPSCGVIIRDPAGLRAIAQRDDALADRLAAARKLRAAKHTATPAPGFCLQLPTADTPAVSSMGAPSHSG